MCYWERKKSLNIKIVKCLVTNLTIMDNFHPREVVGRGGLKQARVVENLKKSTLRVKFPYKKLCQW